MRKVFNKVMAGVMTTALVATLAVGFKTNTTDVKADTANALTGSWTNLAESYEPNDAVILQTKIESTALDNITANISITGWQANWVTETGESNVPKDAIILGEKSATDDPRTWGEKPYQITSTAKAKVVPGNTYKLKFTVNNGMMEADTTIKTEKNITITVYSGIEGDNDNTMLFETVTVPAGATETYEFDVPVSPDYLSNDIQVQLAYGSYRYSYELTQAVKAGKVTEEAAKACKYAYAYGTSEKVNAHGTLAFTDISLMGEKYTQIVIPERPTKPTTWAPEPTTWAPEPTTKAPEPTTKAPEPTTKAPELTTEKNVAGNIVATTTAAPKKEEPTTQTVATTAANESGITTTNTIAKVKIKSAKVTKKKSVKVTWKKAAGTKKYQVQYSLNKKFKKSKTKTTGKLSIILNKLAGGKKYFVRVRGINGSDKGPWSKTKTFKTSK